MGFVVPRLNYNLPTLIDVAILLAHQRTSQSLVKRWSNRTLGKTSYVR